MPKQPVRPKVDHEKIIASELIKIHKELRKWNSFRYKFLTGIITGFGTVVGATVVVSFVVFILSQLAGIGILRPWIEGLLNFAGK